MADFLDHLARPRPITLPCPPARPGCLHRLCRTVLATGTGSGRPSSSAALGVFERRVARRCLAGLSASGFYRFLAVTMISSTTRCGRCGRSRKAVAGVTCAASRRRRCFSWLRRRPGRGSRRCGTGKLNCSLQRDRLARWSASTWGLDLLSGQVKVIGRSRKGGSCRSDRQRSGHSPLSCRQESDAEPGADRTAVFVNRQGRRLAAQSARGSEALCPPGGRFRSTPSAYLRHPPDGRVPTCECAEMLSRPHHHQVHPLGGTRSEVHRRAPAGMTMTFHGTTIIAVRKDRRRRQARSAIGDTVVKSQQDRTLKGGPGAGEVCRLIGRRLTRSGSGSTGISNLRGPRWSWPGHGAIGCCAGWKPSGDRRYRALLSLSGSGELIEPDDGIIAAGSGVRRTAAASLLPDPAFNAREIVRVARIAAEICIFTNPRSRCSELPQ